MEESLSRHIRASDQDQYVLKVFLPLLAVAIILCGGACYYMEKRRKRRIKEGKVKVDQNTEGNLDAAESVISAASSKRRHYMLPTQTTGRLVRAPSTRSTYSTYGGEPPPYELRRNEPRSMSMRMGRGGYGEKMSQDYERSSGPPSVHSASGGYGGRPMSRSHSLVDVRQDNDSIRNRSSYPMRRSQSSNNFNSIDGFGAPDNVYESTSRAGSAMSDRRRISPTQDWENQRNKFSHPSSVSSFPVNQGYPDEYDGRRQTSSGLRRSMSQPNLARTSSRQSARTYPQGILKKIPLSDDGRVSNTTASSDSGIKDIYGEIPINAAFERRMEQQGSHGRPTSRAGSMAGYGSRSTTGYEGYNYHNGAQTMPPHSGYSDNQSIYSVGAAYHQHHPPQGSTHGSVNHGYSHSFDNYQQAPVGYGSNYWEGQQHQASQQQQMPGYNGYGY